MRQRRGADRVVDVVEAGKLELDVPRGIGELEVERDPLEAVQLDRAGGDVEGRACVSALVAAVVAEVADVRGRVDIRSAAADAVLRVGRVLKGGTRHAGVVQAEVDLRAKIAD